MSERQKHLAAVVTATRQIIGGFDKAAGLALQQWNPIALDKFAQRCAAIASHCEALKDAAQSAAASQLEASDDAGD
jgi:hypothetical protein